MSHRGTAKRKRSSWVAVTAAALVLSGGCGEAPDSGAESPSAGQAATIGDDTDGSIGATKNAPEDRPAEAPATTSVATPATPAVGYEIRDFEPVGSGTLTIDGRDYPFSVAGCHFGERTLSNDWIQEIYVLGAGQIDGRPYFVEIKRGRDAQKKRVRTAAINLNFTPLPALYAHEMPITTPVLQMMEKIQQIDAYRSMGVSAVAYDDLSIEGGRLTTTRPVAFMRFTDGGLDGPAGEGTLEVECG